ncbi:MAG: hypothetical protein CVU45_07845, partial [Chloroflexi bacterium HGW-Chloroflexi-7]
MNNLINNTSDENEETTKKRNSAKPDADADSKDTTAPINPKGGTTDPFFTMQFDATQGINDIEDMPTMMVDPVTDDNEKTIIMDELGAPPPGASDALPNHVDETDLGATKVIPTAFAHSMTPPTLPEKSAVPAVLKRKPRKMPAQPKKGVNFNGCLVKGLVILLFAMVLGLVISGAFLVYQYFTIAASLPGIEDIKQKASQFETTRFYDRNGQLL